MVFLFFMSKDNSFSIVRGRSCPESKKGKDAIMRNNITAIDYKVYQTAKIDAAKIIYDEMRRYSPMCGYTKTDEGWNGPRPQLTRDELNETEITWLDNAKIVYDATKSALNTDDSWIMRDVWIGQAGIELSIKKLIMEWACVVSGVFPGIVEAARYITDNDAPYTIDVYHG